MVRFSDILLLHICLKDSKYPGRHWCLHTGSTNHKDQKLQADGFINNVKYVHGRVLFHHK